MPAFQLRVETRTGASTYAFGSSIDHWTYTYTSGPTSLATQTAGANEQYLNYAAATPGSYVVSAQPFDGNSNPLGAPFAIAFTVPNPFPNPVASIPVSVRFVGNPGGAGSGQATCQVLYQNLGALAPGIALDHSVITLTGPSTSIATIAYGARTANFTGLANGLYSFSIQTFDSISTAFGPAMTNGSSGIQYFDSALVSAALIVPTGKAITLSTPATFVGQPGL